MNATLFQTYWAGLTADQKLQLAQLAMSSKAHLQNVAYGFKPVSDWLCVAVEFFSEGAHKCEDLNPDLNWLRLPDPEYPFHAEGRPVIDPTKAEATHA